MTPDDITRLADGMEFRARLAQQNGGTVPHDVLTLYAAELRTLAQQQGDKPFLAPGLWFPLDILGNPMREFAPGKWETAQWPSEQQGNAGGVAVVGWINEDELPDNYPYDMMFPHSKVDGVRLFPVFAPANPPEAGVTGEMVERGARAMCPCILGWDGLLPHEQRRYLVDSRAALAASLAPQPKDAP